MWANPFAIVVMAHLKTQATQPGQETRLPWKLRLWRRLHEAGYDRKDAMELLRFIDWILDLSPELTARFKQEARQIDAEKKMQYLTTFERDGIKIGMEKGIKKGIREGRRVLEEEAGEGRLLLLLDGLDEVPREARGRAESLLGELATRPRSAASPPRSGSSATSPPTGELVSYCSVNGRLSAES